VEIRPFKLDSAAHSSAAHGSAAHGSATHGSAAKAARAEAALSAAVHVSRPSRPFVTPGNITL